MKQEERAESTPEVPAARPKWMGFYWEPPGPNHGPILGVDSPFFSTIVLFKHLPFPWVSGGFLERRIPGKNGEGTARSMCAILGTQLVVVVLLASLFLKEAHLTWWT